MSTEPVEIEVKIHVADLGPIQPILANIGAAPTAPRVYERNIRYENGEGTLTSTHRVVRLRQDTSVRLTYKEPSLQYLDGATART